MDDAVKQQARWRWQEVAEARKIPRVKISKTEKMVPSHQSPGGRVFDWGLVGTRAKMRKSPPPSKPWFVIGNCLFEFHMIYFQPRHQQNHFVDVIVCDLKSAVGWGTVRNLSGLVRDLSGLVRDCPELSGICPDLSERTSPYLITVLMGPFSFVPCWRLE